MMPQNSAKGFKYIRCNVMLKRDKRHDRQCGGLRTYQYFFDLDFQNFFCK